MDVDESRHGWFKPRWDICPRTWQRLPGTPKRSAYDKGAIALPSNCSQPEAASRMLSSSRTTLPSWLSLTTSSRHFIIFIYRSPSNPSAASSASVDLINAFPGFCPTTLSTVVRITPLVTLECYFSWSIPCLKLQGEDTLEMPLEL